MGAVTPFVKAAAGLLVLGAAAMAASTVLFEAGTAPSRPEADPQGGIVGNVVYAPKSLSVSMEQASIRGVLMREGSCLLLGAPPNVRDPYSEPLVWPHGTEWRDADDAVLLPDGTMLRVGAWFTAAGGWHSADSLRDLGFPDAAAGEVRRCGATRADMDAAYVQGAVTVVTRDDPRLIGVSGCVRGGDRSTIVPDVVGRPLHQAIAVMREAGLHVVGTGTPNGDPTGPRAVIRAQEPPAGERVPVGACMGFRTDG